MLVGGLGGRAGGEQQRVEGQLLAARGVRDPCLVVDGDDGVGDEPGANVARDVGHRVARRLPAGERLGDLHRAVREVALRIGERELDAVAGERAELEERFDARDAAAGDEDAKRCGRHGNEATPGAPRRHPQPARAGLREITHAGERARSSYVDPG